MQRVLRERQDAIRRALLEFHGATVCFEQVNASHYGAVLSYNGQNRRVIFSTSTGDLRATKNIMSHIRTTLREMGARKQ